jgi:hypothetical protein
MSYKVFNAPALTTTAMAPVTTGTALKTMLQVAPPSTMQLAVIAWGYTLAAVPGSTGGQFELLETDTAATVVALTEGGIYRSDPNAAVSGLTFGTAATGFTASAEGAIGAARFFDDDLISPTAGSQPLNWDYQFLPDERPVVGSGKFLRLRANFAGAVNALCWVSFVRVG